VKENATKSQNRDLPIIKNTKSPTNTKMILNMAGTWKKGLLVLGLATAVLATPGSYLKGAKNTKQQGQRSLKNGGLAYQIDFAAADPDLYYVSEANPVPFPVPDYDYSPTNRDPRAPVGAGDGDAGNGSTGEGIKAAWFNDASSTNGSSDVKVESLMPEDLYLGQIVPFEIKITVTGLTSPENGNIQFVAGWSIETTSGGDFGYDPEYGVIAAFVDKGDGTWTDSNGDGHGEAKVSSFSWSIVNDIEIQGVFDVTGLDDGDEVVVEVWVVIKKTFPNAGATGNVHSRLIDAISSPGESFEDDINTGTQTVPMMQLSKGGPLDSPISLVTASVEDLLCE
jgi:hypothetical protein